MKKLQRLIKSVWDIEYHRGLPSKDQHFVRRQRPNRMRLLNVSKRRVYNSDNIYRHYKDGIMNSYLVESPHDVVK
jgi:hypothetical protein